MKFLIVFACALTAHIVYINAYSFVIPAKPSHPGVCIYNGLFLKPGDNSLPSSCQNMRCNDDGSILVQGCGHFDLTDCRIIDPINLHKPYPDCCRMNFLCPGVNGEELPREVSPINRRIYY